MRQFEEQDIQSEDYRDQKDLQAQYDLDNSFAPPDVLFLNQNLQKLFYVGSSTGTAKEISNTIYDLTASEVFGLEYAPSITLSQALTDLYDNKQDKLTHLS